MNGESEKRVWVERGSFCDYAFVVNEEFEKNCDVNEVLCCFGNGYLRVYLGWDSRYVINTQLRVGLKIQTPLSKIRNLIQLVPSTFCCLKL